MNIIQNKNQSNCCLLNVLDIDIYFNIDRDSMKRQRLICDFVKS